MECLRRACGCFKRAYLGDMPTVPSPMHLQAAYAAPSLSSACTAPTSENGTKMSMTCGLCCTPTVEMKPELCPVQSVKLENLSKREATGAPCLDRIPGAPNRPDLPPSAFSGRFSQIRSWSGFASPLAQRSAAA